MNPPSYLSFTDAKVITQENAWLAYREAVTRIEAGYNTLVDVAEKNGLAPFALQKNGVWEPIDWNWSIGVLVNCLHVPHSPVVAVDATGKDQYIVDWRIPTFVESWISRFTLGQTKARKLSTWHTDRRVPVR